MRPGLNAKRPRGNRSNIRRTPGHHRSHAIDSNGPDVKIRGSASQILEKYLALARDANMSGDRVKAENYLQHADHYYRILNSSDSSQRSYPPSPPRVGDDAKPRSGDAQAPVNEAQP